MVSGHFSFTGIQTQSAAIYNTTLGSSLNNVAFPVLSFSLLYQFIFCEENSGGDVLHLSQVGKPFFFV